jgi:hypothetical protein
LSKVHTRQAHPRGCVPECACAPAALALGAGVSVDGTLFFAFSHATHFAASRLFSQVQNAQIHVTTSPYLRINVRATSALTPAGTLTHVPSTFSFCCMTSPL